MASVLGTVKKSLGIEPTFTAFDDELISEINTVLAILYQLGIGDATGSSITDADDTWADIYGEDNRLNMIQTYVCKRVKLLFDPSASSYVISAIERACKEIEWRLIVNIDIIKSEGG